MRAFPITACRLARLACLCLLFAGCGHTEKDGLEDFAESFREANQTQSIEPMLALYALDGTTESTINLLKNALHFEFGIPIQSIEFEPLSGAPEETIRFVHQGIPYGPTLEPRYRMRVRYSTEDQFESLFTLGQNQAGAWRIISSRPVQPNP